MNNTFFVITTDDLVVVSSARAENVKVADVTFVERDNLPVSKDVLFPTYDAAYARLQNTKGYMEKEAIRALIWGDLNYSQHIVLGEMIKKAKISKFQFTIKELPVDKL
jgi:hypothetical protein